MSLDLEALLDEALDSTAAVSDELGLDLDAAIAAESMTPLAKIEVVQIQEGELDPRLKLISHSSRTTMHKCPRKYQLYRLSSSKVAGDPDKDIEQGVTFAYGTAVGVGIQSYMEGKSLDESILDTFLAWDVDLLDNNPRQKKSFWLAVFAVQKFASIKDQGILADYELVYYKGKPATELSFQINLPEGFKYRGFVDVVLRHKTSGEILVLELKTTSGTAQSATYKNSGQALGYSVVLDVLFPSMSSYTVLYLVYESKSMKYVELPFKKSLLQRAIWLQELLIDSEMIGLYASYDTFPMHGESCFDFFRECEYLGLCGMSTENLVKPLTTKIVADIKEADTTYQFVVDFYTLVAAQIKKGE
jgi:hypothetical protein